MLFLTFVLKNLLRRKVRSALTLVGVGISVAAVVALVGIAQRFESSFRDLYSRRGVDLIVVRAGTRQRMASSLPERVGDRIRQLRGVRTVSPGLMDMISFEQRQLISVPVQGWAPDSFMFNDLRFLSGRKLEAGDRRGAMLGKTLAANLDKSAGDRVEMFGEEFHVVGVFQSFNVYENGSAIMLLDDLQELMNRQGQVTGFQVILEDGPDKKALVERVREEINSLRDENGRSLGLDAMPTDKYVSSMSQIEVAQAMAWVTSVIALMIGAIGVLNTMVMSVFERTREFGILRAIGWRRGRVMRMILYESLLLSLAGAGAGIVVAVVLTRLLSKLPQGSGFIEGSVDAGVMLRGLLIALFVGLAGGIYPALRGARMLPTEALRHE
jgi:putative ABC transport system permease protein